MATIRITMKDNSQDVMDLLARNINAALTAMGIKAESLIIGQMLRGFGRPIRKTGTLLGDVNYEIHPDTRSVDVGNSKTYAIFVHEGTSRMAARPYITNALTSASGADAIRTAAENALRQGF